ncbi:MAG: ROK family protein, partial [Deltaproteobacteria bacterium]|nr:ROK family protein [Deltaproteobacteria bacterium]
MHSVSKNLSQSSVVLSLDLGGTHLKGGVVSSAGKLLYSNTFSSFASFSAEAILENLFKAVEHLESYTLSHQKKILGVGLGVPGILDSRRGIVYRSPHFKSFQDFPIRKILQKKIKYPFVIDNDA